jgi:hypothetical protein
VTEVVERETLRFVPNSPFREVVRERGLGVRGLGTLVGMDARHLGRALGMYPEPGTSRYRESLRYETAVKLADALGLDYVDCGV